jgi:hypothetical protein
LESSWRLNWWRLGANNYFGPFQDRGFPFRLCAQMLDFPDRWLTNVSFFGTRYNFALFVPLGTGFATGDFLIDTLGRPPHFPYGYRVAPDVH